LERFDQKLTIAPKRLPIKLSRPVFYGPHNLIGPLVHYTKVALCRNKGWDSVAV
jgi:hypothetical protein